MKAWFPVCFPEDFQYLCNHNLAPLRWKVDSIPAAKTEISSDSWARSFDKTKSRNQNEWNSSHGAKTTLILDIIKYMKTNLHKTSGQPIIPLLHSSPKINGLHIHLLAELQTSFWIYSAAFVCSTPNCKISTGSNFQMTIKLTLELHFATETDKQK